HVLLFFYHSPAQGVKSHPASALPEEGPRFSEALPSSFGPGGPGPVLAYRPAIPGEKPSRQDQDQQKHRPETVKEMKHQFPARTQHIPQSDEGGAPDHRPAVGVQTEPGVRKSGYPGQIGGQMTDSRDEVAKKQYPVAVFPEQKLSDPEPSPRDDEFASVPLQARIAETRSQYVAEGDP